MKGHMLLLMLVATFCTVGFGGKKKRESPSCDFTTLTKVEQTGDSISDSLRAAFFASFYDTVCLNEPDFVDRLNEILFPLIERMPERILAAAETLADVAKNAFLRQLEAPQAYSPEKTAALYAKIDALEIERRWKKRLLLALQRAINRHHGRAPAER